MKSLILPFAMVLANEEGLLRCLLSPSAGWKWNPWWNAVGFVASCGWLISNVMQLRGRHDLR